MAKRKKYSCDFETTTDLDDCRVWGYGFMEIDNLENYHIGNSLDEFMQWAIHSRSDLYFHNLKFDGDFIINWLLKKGWRYDPDGKQRTFDTVISSMGQWYKIDICTGYFGKKKIHTTIYDSLKKLPFQVKKIAKDFKLSILKGDIDYHKYRPIGYEPDDIERSYIKNDIEIVAQALKIQFDQGLTKITNGSDSLHGFKTIFSSKLFKKHFPILSLEMDAEIRKAYRGGFTWLNDKFRNQEIGQGIVFDVNSLYPSQMYNRELPYGVPYFFEGKYEDDPEYPLHIQHIRCDFELKKGKIPTIQIKNNGIFKENEYLKSSNSEYVDLYVTNIDLALIREHYDLYDVEFVDGWKFKSKTGIFNQFIDKWMYIKTHNTGAIKLLAKLMLNSLYGKFATNPDVTGKVPYLKEDGSCGYKVGDEEYRDPVYTPMGVFITSWARYTTITSAQKCYDRIIYCDTDSMHLTGTEIPDNIKDIVDDDILGYWSHESTFKRAKYIRQKTYIQDIIQKDGSTKTSVKCAGMPDGIKEKVTFENFKKGYSSYGKLLPKHVNGGTVLVDTEFTIK